MTIEEFVSTEHNGSGAAKGFGYVTIHDADCFGYGYDCYTVCESGEGGSSAERKSCGFGEASGSGIVHSDDIRGWNGSGWAKGYSPSSNSRPDRCLIRRKY